MWHVRERGFMITSRGMPEYWNHATTRPHTKINPVLERLRVSSFTLRSRSGIEIPMSIPPPNSQPKVRQIGIVTGGNLVGMVAAVRERESSLHL